MRRLILALTALGVLAAPGRRGRADPGRSTSPPRSPTRSPTPRTARAFPVRLPAKMTVEQGDLFPSGTAHQRNWAMGLDAAADCGGANACFVAAFTGERGGDRRSVASACGCAAGGAGHFTPLSCGASCAPPQIQWKMGSTLYTIQARVGTKSTERRMLIRMANSAILHGRR